MALVTESEETFNILLCLDIDGEICIVTAKLNQASPSIALKRYRFFSAPLLL